MQSPPKIAFHGVEHSETLEAKILEKIEHLEKFHPRITSCGVVVDAIHHRGHKGKLYNVKIDINIPGQGIFIRRDAGVNHAHEDVYVAVRDAFNEAQRRLEDYVRKRSGYRGRMPEEPVRGQVDQLFPEDGYGFIEAEDGQHIYFNLDKVSKRQAKLIEVGSKVQFKISESSDGPFAQHISVQE